MIITGFRNVISIYLWKELRLSNVLKNYIINSEKIDFCKCFETISKSEELLSDLLSIA